MSGFVLDGFSGDWMVNDLNGNSTAFKENSTRNMIPSSPLIPQSGGLSLPIDDMVNTSMDRLYDHACEMQSSDQSSSRPSFRSHGEGSRIDSELHNLARGEIGEVGIMGEEEVEKPEDDSVSGSISKMKNGSTGKKSGKLGKQSLGNKSVSLGHPQRSSRLQLESEESVKSSPNGKLSHEKPPTDKWSNNGSRKLNGGVVPVTKQRNLSLGEMRLQNEIKHPSEAASDNPHLGPFLLKQARDLISSGDNPHKSLELAFQAAKSFEKCANGKPSLELVMSLHVIAAIYCSLGQHNQAIPILERSINIPVMEEGQDHALAKFAGQMQLGDTYAVLGELEHSILCYTTGLEIQRQLLGDMDTRVGETCRYLAEAHLQALHLDEAERLCHVALDIHKKNGSPASLEEAADRRLMGLICETKGDHEAALEHLILASKTIVANGQETEVASVDCSIGDTYLSLAQYDEAVLAYKKALTVFKSSKGENHPAVASVLIRLADLYNKTGNIGESKSYCENALGIYEKPIPGIPMEEIASGFIDVSAIYESMNEPEQALGLLQKALDIYDNIPGQQSMIAGIEAQMGVMCYMLANYSDSYTYFKSAIAKLRASGEKKSAFFAIALNQMGLACVQRYAINEAVSLFEEAKNILVQECGPYHPDTLGVCSNLAGTYDAMGRLNEAIEILEYVVGTREEKLGTANPDVDDEKRRLAELLKEAGKVRNRKSRSLETLFGNNSHNMNKDGIEV